MQLAKQFEYTSYVTTLPPTLLVKVTGGSSIPGSSNNENVIKTHFIICGNVFLERFLSQIEI